MNEVYVSGNVESISALHKVANEKTHLMLHVCFSYQNQRKVIKHELYTVNVWNGLAFWAERFIKPGMSVMVHGYLSQHASGGNNRVEITAKHICLDQHNSSGNQVCSLHGT